MQKWTSAETRCAIFLKSRHDPCRLLRPRPRLHRRNRWFHNSIAEMRYDIAIAGAGPAGSALALLAAKAGLRVLLAERSQFERPRIGETAPPELRPLLARAGLAHVLNSECYREAPAVVSVWGSSIPHERHHIF